MLQGELEIAKHSTKYPETSFKEWYVILWNARRITTFKVVHRFLPSISIMIDFVVITKILQGLLCIDFFVVFSILIQLFVDPA